MKVLDKTEVIRQKMTNNVLNERKILASINHPLVVNLQCALQTPLDLFMIVDLMHGGDMRYHLKNDKSFADERVKFYIAQTAICLEYLHSQGIIHRDVKPDNLLLDAAGNCHITDFNLSVRLPPEGSRGIAGTRPYMAPEVLKKEYYGFAADWWSLGVMLYEFAFGRLPFHGDAETLKRLIIDETPRYPTNADKDLVKLIKGLMNKNPEKRYGYKQIRTCGWFGPLDWEKLANKELTPPWQPDQRRANCDGSYDLDEQFEVKKKRVPLTEEQEASLKEWDYQPGQKDRIDSSILPTTTRKRSKRLDKDDEEEENEDNAITFDEDAGRTSKKKQRGAKKSNRSSQKTDSTEKNDEDKEDKSEEDGESEVHPKATKKKQKKSAPKPKESESSEDKPDEAADATGNASKEAPAEGSSTSAGSGADKEDKEPAPAEKKAKKGPAPELPDSSEKSSESQSDASEEKPKPEKSKKPEKKSAAPSKTTTNGAKKKKAK